MLDPVRILRRWRSFKATVAEEVNILIDQYGADARRAAEERLRAGSLRRHEKRVLAAAIKQLQR